MYLEILLTKNIRIKIIDANKIIKPWTIESSYGSRTVRLDGPFFTISGMCFLIVKKSVMTLISMYKTKPT